MNYKLFKMKKLLFILLFVPLFIISCSESLEKSKLIEIKKSLNQNNNQVSVIINVSYTEGVDEIKKFIKEEQAPLFYNLEDSGIVRFEWFLNEKENTGTLVEVFKNSNAFEELGSKVIGSPINVRFNELFKIENLTVLGEIDDEFKNKLQPMGPTFKSYAGGIN
jgi:hypothetical protein